MCATLIRRGVAGIFILSLSGGAALASAPTFGPLNTTDAALADARDDIDVAAELARPFALSSPSDTDTDLPDRRAQWFIDIALVAVSGYTQVRENATEGTRLSLHDLGLNRAETFALGISAPVGEASEVRARVRYYYLTGHGNFDDSVVFNGVTYDPGKINADPLFFDVRVDYRGDVLDFGDGGHLRFIAGADFKYLNFATSGHTAATSGGHDKSENFWRQELPLPSLGLDVQIPLSKVVDVTGEAFGFRILRWDSLRNEGGTIYLSQDDFEASLGLKFHVSPWCDIGVGARFDYFSMNEQSNEDGNRFLMRDVGLFANASLSF
ncbi:MAG: hypothetical protein HYR85_03725 [Planctomycetes bacterium]|nr:hypothetical protein [Planctomycetota bacterium]MBI3848519.1 hypothetical protein [Planctomycetota bacterium]